MAEGRRCPQRVARHVDHDVFRDGGADADAMECKGLAPISLAISSARASVWARKLDQRQRRRCFGMSSMARTDWRGSLACWMPGTSTERLASLRMCSASSRRLSSTVGGTVSRSTVGTRSKPLHRSARL